MSVDDCRRRQLAEADERALGDDARITLMGPTIMATAAAARIR